MQLLSAIAARDPADPSIFQEKSSNMNLFSTSALGLLVSCCLASTGLAQTARSPDPDTFTEHNRIFVLSDVGNEPDDQMSLVRLLLYSNEIDIEGLAATTSNTLPNRTNPQTMRMLVDAYGKVRPNLLLHAKGWPTAEALNRLIVSGPPKLGLEGIDLTVPSPAAQQLIRAADKSDTRPLWISVWGGASVLAEALQIVRKTRSAEEVDILVGKLRVYSISDQDDAGPWIRREFPKLRYIVSPGGIDDFGSATWTGISGEALYRNDQGAVDTSLVSNEWLDQHIRKGPLGKHYPYVHYIMEGDTPAFLNLVPNGLNSAMSPTWGGWGGRYVYRTPHGESRPIWSQGGLPLFGRNSRDEVVGKDGSLVLSDQATIWRWRSAYQHDFAARMAWTIKPFAEANHRPVAVVNGDKTGGPIVLSAVPGQQIELDASESSDPDRSQHLSYRWFVYGEAGASLTSPAKLEIAGADGPRAVITMSADCTPPLPWMKVPCGPRTGHIILEVKDDGKPSLTSYRRIIVNVGATPAAAPAPAIEGAKADH